MCRHEALRTVFVAVNGEPMQEIAATARFALQVTDLGACADEERETLVRAQKIEEARTGFDLSTGPLIRGRLLRLTNEEHVLLVAMHHIVSDGWSRTLFIRELAYLYRTHGQASDRALPPLPIQYADYAQWQRQQVQADVQQGQLEYWRARLAGAPPQLELPTDRPRPAVRSYRGEVGKFSFDALLSSQLRALAQRHNVTLFMLCSAAWSILLSRLSGQEDVLIGTPVANRTRPELEHLIGFFVSTVVLRFDVQSQLRFEEFLAQVKDTTLEAHENQDVPFEQVVEALQPQRSRSRNPIFQVVFGLQNAPKSELQLPGVCVGLEQDVYESSVFDLMVSLEERADGIAGHVNYAADLFDRLTIERWIACFVHVLTQVAAGYEGRIGELPILPDEQYRQVTELFNATHMPYRDRTLTHELFEEQVARTPLAVAALYGGESLTYEELNRRANQVAGYLRDKGVRIDQLVGLCMQPSLEMIVGLLGILKAGAAYLPLDPDYPVERLAYMLEDASPYVVLTQARLRGSLPQTGAHVVSLDSDWGDIACYDAGNIDPSSLGLTPSHLAYVIYTSGSTGLPKGVMIAHRGLCSLAAGSTRLLAVDEGSRLLQFASLSFDACTWEWTNALTAGACLCMASRDELAPGEPLHTTLSTQRITHATLPPVAIGALTDDAKLAALHTLIAAGEACPAKLPQQWAGWASLRQCIRADRDHRVRERAPVRPAGERQPADRPTDGQHADLHPRRAT